MQSLKRSVQGLAVIMIVLLAWMNVGEAADCKVLAVMAFQSDFFRMEEIQAGIDEVLGGACEVQYVYLNALSEPQNIEARAKEAYAVFQELQPNGVIATNDEAQAYFVAPYLKDQTETPVIFCDINEAPQTFGYPTEQISGILRRPPVGEAIVFARQLAPDINTVGILFAEEATSEALAKQISAERDTYAADVLEPSYVNTFDAAIATAGELKNQCDALFIGPIASLLVDAAGNPLPMPQLVTAVAQEFGKPTITIWDIVVRSGALCAVSDFGQEQGQVAAEMLQQAMAGTPMSELPVTKNQYGQRILNKTVLKTLGITPSRRVLVGTELVETIN
jgi:ABC-type uncharacterized transport system substrate-binding protein